MGVISLICSLVVLASFLLLFLVFGDLTKITRFVAISTVVVSVGMGAQIFYVIRTQRLLTMDTYNDLETIDNEMAFSDDEQLNVEERAGIDVFAAVIAGLVWVFLFVMFGLFPSALFSGDWEVTAVLSKIFHLGGIIGGFPSLIYNLRTWNRMVVR